MTPTQRVQQGRQGRAHARNFAVVGRQTEQTPSTPNDQPIRNHKDKRNEKRYDRGFGQ
jgi:hypothetical protein